MQRPHPAITQHRVQKCALRLRTTWWSAIAVATFLGAPHTNNDMWHASREVDVSKIPTLKPATFQLLL